MVDYLLYFRGLLQHFVIFGLTIYALFQGGQPERFAGLTLSGMVLLDYLYHIIFPQSGVYDQIDLGHLAIDLLVLAALASLAMRANRIYPLWMLGAQLMSTVMHFDRAISTDMQGIAYLVLTRAPSYIQIVALAAGLFNHRRRIERHGNYRSWRTCSSRSSERGAKP